MKHIIAIAISILVLGAVAPGCAHHPQTAEALFDAADKGLAGAGEVVRQSQPLVDEATNLRIEKCRGAEDRAACMGHLAKAVAPLYERFGAAYDAAAKALDELEEAYGDLAPIIEEAKQEMAK